ncbi:uncharacterized protein [Panulirus ornatus]|uniref:uncharacterized protein isoform X2 n=1 Tax=Panulirus ornatus TaxID=150431 RepID=UPI003A8BA711
MSVFSLQAAVTEGAAGGQVLFVAPKKLDHLPPSVHGMPQPSSSAMNNIQFLYASQTLDLQGYLASLHMILAKDRPTLIIIDDLQFYSTTPHCRDAATQMVNAARILSLAQESAEFCSTSAMTMNKDNNTGSKVSCQCSVLVSWTEQSSSFLKHCELEAFAKDFCHHVWTVHVNNKGRSRSAAEYHLVEEQSGNVCTISFFDRQLSSSSHHLFLHQVTLEVEETKVNLEEDIAAKNQNYKGKNIEKTKKYSH